MRPGSPPNYESLLRKVKQSQAFSVDSTTTTFSPINIFTTSVPSAVPPILHPTIVTTGLSSIQGVQTASLGSPFVSTATDTEMSLAAAAAAAFYNQLAALDPANIHVCRSIIC